MNSALAETIVTFAPLPSDRRFIDRTGQQLGRLTVLGFLGNGRWLCRCECGKKSIVNRTAFCPTGNTKSCGCYQAERRKDRYPTHDRTKTRVWSSWQHMRSRCKPTSHAWEYYGARGVTVCERWLESFENFYADMGDPPTEEHTIDRYPNNDGNYEPGNCRWATRAEQVRNRRPFKKKIRQNVDAMLRLTSLEEEK